jgi:hypothetical protein
MDSVCNKLPTNKSGLPAGNLAIVVASAFSDDYKESVFKKDQVMFKLKDGVSTTWSLDILYYLKKRRTAVYIRF